MILGGLTWSDSVKFLYPTESGMVVPVEVKSAARTKAKSLSVFIKKHQPNLAVKFIGSTWLSSRSKTARFTNLLRQLYFKVLSKT